MAPMSPVPAARSVSSRMRNFSPAVNVGRVGRFDTAGLPAAGAGTTRGLRPSSVPAPAAACASATLLGMTTRQFSYALKSKLLGGLCLIIIGTEGAVQRQGLQLAAQLPPRQVRHLLRRGGVLDQRLQHRPAGHAEHLADDAGQLDVPAA